MNDLVTKKDTAVAQYREQQSSLMALIMDAAKDPDFDAGKMQSLINMKEQMEASDARKAFNAAMHQFHMDAPIIKKTKPVYVKGKKMYDYAPFEEVIRKVKPKLLEVGIVPTWENRPMEDGSGRLEVTCVLRHELGHEVRSSLAGIPDASGGKQAIQGVGSTDSYLRRYTLLAACGLVVEGEDTDGHVEPETINEVQRDHLLSLLAQSDSNIDAFCRLFGVDAVAKIPASKYNEAENKILNKINKGKAQ